MELLYTTKRSAKRKKLTITVERDRSVIVHAPEGVSDMVIEQVVESKRQWIYEKIKHKQKYKELPHPPGKELVSGESALYLGRQYRIEIVESDQKEIIFDQRFMVPLSQPERQTESMRDWYISRAKGKILPRVRQYANQIGVEYKGARIVDNRYRWGSCSAKDNVNLNWRLIKAPMFVIDYVIVHELAHLIEANHTPRFWNIVQAQVPKVEKARSWLVEHGQVLEQEI
jgi:predicted metal-dependent hydrolase